MKTRLCVSVFVGLWLSALAGWTRAADGVVYEGQQGPGKGKQIVFLAGDEEYRSEEGLPMLAKILAVRHGFKCTVLFAINPADGTIDPLTLTNMPGMADSNTKSKSTLSAGSQSAPPGVRIMMPLVWMY